MSAATQLREKATAIAEAAPEVDAHHATINAALVAALAHLTVVERSRTADAGSYSYGYADIADVVKLTRPILASHGIVALTPIHDHGSGLACTVTLLHESGDRLDLGPFPFPHGRDAQATGSMVTYHRRYALVAALGIAAGDDDDGASAHKATPPAPEWNKNLSKQQLRLRLGGDNEQAKQAWEWGSGDDLPLTQEAADDLADRWLSRPMIDEEPAPPADPEPSS